MQSIRIGLVALFLIVVGCADEAVGPDPSPPDPTEEENPAEEEEENDLSLEVSVHPDTTRAVVGAGFPVSARVDSEPPLEYTPSVVWSSSDEGVVTVEADGNGGAISLGNVEAVGLGAAFIIASATDSTGTISALDSVAVFVEWERLLDLPDVGNQPVLFERALGSGRVFVTAASGLLVSDDDGAHWSPVETGLSPNSWYFSLDFSPHDGDVLLAAAYDRSSSTSVLLRSRDGGGMWEDVSAGIPYGSDRESVYDAAFDPSHGSSIYALSSYEDLRIYKSTDLGLTWVHQGTTYPYPEGGYPRLFSAPTHPGNLYIGSHRSFHSDDEGETWTEIVRPEQEVSFYPDFTIIHVDRVGRAYVRDYNWDGSGDVRIHRFSLTSGTLERLYDRLDWLADVTTNAEDERFIAALSPYGSGPGSILRYSSDDGVTWEATPMPQGIYGDPQRLVLVPGPAPHLLAYVKSGTSGSVWRYAKAD